MKNLKMSVLVIGVVGILLGISGCSPSIGNSGSGEGSSGGSDSVSGSIAGKIERVLEFFLYEDLGGSFGEPYAAGFLLDDGSLVERDIGTVENFSPVNLKNIKYIPNYSLSRNTNYSQCALTHNSDVHCWGTNEYGQVGNGSYDSTFKETIDVCLNEECVAFRPVSVFDSAKILSGVESLIAPELNTYCALKFNGEAYCWGKNNGFDSSGDLMVNYPFQVDPNQIQFTSSEFSGDIRKIEHNEISKNLSCEINDFGKVTCLGHNTDEGMLFGKENKALPSSAIPIEIVGIEQAKSFIGNFSYSSQLLSYLCVLRNDDKIQCWGDIPGDVVTFTP